MVGSTPKELESANELIRFDHMYYKMVPDIGAEADVETCPLDVSNNGNTLRVESGEIGSVIMFDAVGNRQSAIETNVDNESNDSISAFAILDLIDLAADLEELNQSSFTSCFGQDSELSNASAQSCTVDSTSSESVQTYNSCRSPPFMQLNDEITVNLDSECYNVSSPSSGYFSTHSDVKSPIMDDLSESVLALTDDDCGYSWEETCTLFPSLESYN